MNTPNQIRRDLADTLEEIGQAMGLLREAADEEVNRNLDGAKLCASDALDILSSLECTFSALAARTAKFSEI
jgi:hypothetical protein